MYQLVQSFKNKIKDIDPELLSVYEKLCEIQVNNNLYIPGVYDYKIRNVPEQFVNFLHQNIGVPTKANLYMYKDRSKALSLEHLDEIAVQESLKGIDILSQKIACRGTYIVNINKEKWTLDQVLGSLHTLRRFPLLVVINEKNALDDYHTLFGKLRLLYPAAAHAVLFRLPNHGDQNIEFNKLVAEHKTNNPIDENTKIVYINHKRVPKPLIKSNWQAKAVLSLRSEREHNQVQNFLEPYDLIIQYDNEESQWNMWHHEMEII